MPTDRIVDALICVRCGRPVVRGAEHYEVFERMHYVCFHYEFEHEPADPDEDCRVAGCPSASLTGGHTDVVATLAALALEVAEGAPWLNGDLFTYLEALSRWLANSGGIYADQDRVAPGNGWEVMNLGLRAATNYE